MTLGRVLEELGKVEPSQIEYFSRSLLKVKDRGGKVYVAGNGGSSALASHFASDLMNLGFEVKCLSDNISRLTALTNDYGWEFVYIMQMKNHFRKKDGLILISVHGSIGGGKEVEWSTNLYLAAEYANTQGGRIFLIGGNDGGKLASRATYMLTIKSDEVYVAEGIHSVLAHLVCEQLKELMEK